MRIRMADLMFAVACLLSWSAVLFLGHRYRVIVAAQQQRTAAATACSAQVLVAIHQTGACQAADPTGELMARGLELSREATRLVTEQIAMNREVDRRMRADPSGVDPPAWRDLQVKADAHRLLLDAIVRRGGEAVAAVQGPARAHNAEMARLNGNSSRLLVQQAKLTAAVAAGYCPPSRVRPWATVLAALLPLAWATRSLWLRRRRLGQLRDRRCVVCNYDLRATPERCPECGAVSA